MLVSDGILYEKAYDFSRIIVTDITTIDKARLGRRIGRLTPECLATVEKLLKNHLEL